MGNSRDVPRGRFYGAAPGPGVPLERLVRAPRLAAAAEAPRCSRPADSPATGVASAAGQRWLSGWLAVSPFAVVLLGFALRAWHVAAFSVTSDELDSRYFATLPLRDLFAALATHEPHPPLYYLFLHGWLILAGSSELAMRFPSVLLGALAVACAYNAGRIVGGRAAGLAAAAILATSQFSVLHAQEARMYAALQAWAALFLAALLHDLIQPTRRNGIILALAGLLAAYTHYHGLLLVALGVIPVVLIAPWRAWPLRLAPFAAIGVVYLPWIIFAHEIFLVYRGWMPVVPPLAILRQSAVAYSLGVGVDGLAARFALLVLPAFAAGGLAVLALQRRWRSLLVLLCLGALPLIVVMAGGAVGRPLYNERYLIVVTPAYAVLAGHGLARLAQRRTFAPLSLAALVGLSAVALPAYFWPTTLPNPDFRAATAYVTSNAGPRAEVVLPWPRAYSIPYYLQNRLPTYAAPDHPSPAVIDANLRASLAGKREAWFVRYATDPGDDAMTRWLESNAYFLGDRWITQVQVVTYALPDARGIVQRSIGASLADGVQIGSSWLGADLAQPGGRVLAGFRWTNANPISPSTKVSLRLVDPWGQTVGELDRPLINPGGVVHLDAPPVWQGALAVPPDAVPGPYHLEARFYEGDSGQAITVTDPSGARRAALDLGAPTIEPRDAATLNPNAPLDASAVALGSGLFAQKVSLAGAPYTQLAHLDATFVWASQARPTGSILPELALQSATGQIVASARRADADQPYPLGQLRAGERVRERLDLSLRTVTQSGRYTVVLRAGPDRPWAALGAIDVTVDPARVQPVPTQQTRSDLFDGAIQLIGADRPTGPVRAGSTFTVGLGWQTETRPTRRYTVFVHLARSATDAPVAQNDGPPGGASAPPTIDWTVGDTFVDQHPIAVPATVASGTYHLLVGLYEADTGRRAGVVGGPGPGVTANEGQEVDLGAVQVVAP